MLSTIVQVKIISNQASNCIYIKIIIHFTFITYLKSYVFRKKNAKKQPFKSPVSVPKRLSDEKQSLEAFIANRL